MFAGQSKKRNVKFIRPPNLLKQKVGTGGISVDKLNKAQELIGQSSDLFIPFATETLAEIRKQIDAFDTRHNDGEAYIEDFIHPIMDIKANGAMLGYPMASHVSDVCLHFLEVIDTMTHDALQIIDVTHKALSVIVTQDMKGFDKDISTGLRKELNQACDRYFDKHGTAEDVNRIEPNLDMKH